MSNAKFLWWGIYTQSTGKEIKLWVEAATEVGARKRVVKELGLKIPYTSEQIKVRISR